MELVNRETNYNKVFNSADPKVGVLDPLAFHKVGVCLSEQSEMLCFVLHPPVGVQSIAISVSVCLSARISQKPNVKISRSFLYMLLMAQARSSSDDSAVHCVLPALWVLSCFHIIGQMHCKYRLAVIDIASYSS